MATILIGCLGVIAFVALTIFVLAFVRAFTISTLWAWFVVPTFGIAPLSLPVAYGVVLLVGLFTPLPKSEKKNDAEKRKDAGGAILTSILHCGLTLLFGWIVETVFM